MRKDMISRGKDIRRLFQTGEEQRALEIWVSTGIPSIRRSIEFFHTVQQLGHVFRLLIFLGCHHLKTLTFYG